jgi:hypothetical protein
MQRSQVDGYTEPFWGNGSVNTFPRQRLGVQQRKHGVSAWSVLSCYKGRKKSVESQSSVARRWPVGNFVNAKTEDSPLLKAVARERLVKTQQTIKRLEGAMCELWRFAVALYLLLLTCHLIDQ